MKSILFLSSALVVLSLKGYAGDANHCQSLCHPGDMQASPERAKQCQTYCAGLGGIYEPIKKQADAIVAGSPATAPVATPSTVTSIPPIRSASTIFNHQAKLLEDELNEAPFREKMMGIGGGRLATYSNGAYEGFSKKLKQDFLKESSPSSSNKERFDKAFEIAERLIKTGRNKSDYDNKISQEELKAAIQRAIDEKPVSSSATTG